MFGGFVSYPRALVVALLVAVGCADGPEPPIPDAPSQPLADLRAEAVDAWSQREDADTTTRLVRAFYPEWAPLGNGVNVLQDRHAAIIAPALDPAVALHVTPPARAGDPLELKVEGYTFRVRPLDGDAASTIERRGAAVFSGPRRMWMPAGDWRDDGATWRTTRVEEYEVRAEGGGTWRARYRLELPAGAWQVREDAELVELSPAGKAAVLRMHRPEARDARGTIRVGTLRIEEASYLAWGHIDATLELDLADLEGPVVIDPAYSVVGMMDYLYKDQTSTLLPNGNVLFTGGKIYTAQPAPVSHVQTYVPDFGTRHTLRPKGSAPFIDGDDGEHTATMLTNVDVLLAGRVTAQNAYRAERLPLWRLYEEVTNEQWPRTGPFVVNLPLRNASATLLADGKVLVVGGTDPFSQSYATSQVYDPATTTWSSTGAPSVPRGRHTATLLPSGKVLIVGGLRTQSYDSTTASAELWDPSTGTWTVTGSMTTPRALHTATLLPDGKVLVVGGASRIDHLEELRTAEIYDPATGTWSTTTSMTMRREAHTAALLPNGKVAIVGGLSPQDYQRGRTLAEHFALNFQNIVAEVYDPATATWTTTTSNAPIRAQQSMTMLPSGKFLITGGDPYWTTAPMDHYSQMIISFDLTIGTWAAGAQLNTARTSHASTVLPDGNVLVAGGVGAGGGPVTSAETYNTTTGAWSGTTSGMSAGRSCHTQTLLPNGKVLVTGGITTSGSATASAELYDPVTRTFSATGNLLAARQCHVATLLANGKVLVSGGQGASGVLASVELYDPLTGTWSATGALATARAFHTATLRDGKVIVAGGQTTAGTPTASAEAWDPATGAWSSAGSLITARKGHTATLMRDGSIVLAGGNGPSGFLASIERYTGTGFEAAGNLLFARAQHTANLLPGGEIIFNAGNTPNGIWGVAESYDYQTKKGEQLAHMTWARAGHTTTLLPNGKLLVVGGENLDGSMWRVEIYDDAGGAAAARIPQIAAATPSSIEPGPLTVTGSGFYGKGGSGGARLHSNTDYPLVALQALNGGARHWLRMTSFTATTANVTVPTGLPVGYYFLWMFVEGIPTSKVVFLSEKPVAHPQTLSTAEDTPLPVTLAATSNAGTLAYTILTPPAHGTLSGTAPNVTYTPAADYVGTDSFTFKVSNGYRESLPATVDLTVTAVNDLPIANAQSVTTAEDTSVAITLTGSDLESPVTFAVTTQPAHGTLTGTAPNLTYAPAANYFGSDSFTFEVRDGTATTAATVSLTVTSVNDLPAANALSVTTAEDTSIGFVLSGTDVESPLAYIVTALPAHGTLSGTAPNLSYTPAANYVGPDSITFKVNDGTVDSATALVSITVTPVNDTPIASSMLLTVPEDGTLPITLVASDVESAVTYTLLSMPANGTLTGTAPNLTYKPAANFFGADGFTFSVSDGALTSTVATVAITVTSVNDAPIAHPQTLTVLAVTPKAIVLTGSDTESGPLTYSIVTPPAHGTLTGTPPNITYTSTAGFSGIDTFTFKVNDGGLDSPPATVSVSVTHVPVVTSQNLTTAEDTPLPLVLTASDADGGPLAYTIVTPPARGTLSGTAPNLTYTPAADYVGTDSFTFRVSDGLYTSTIATIALTITPVEDAPIAVTETVSVWEDSVDAPITLRGTDAEGDPITFTLLSSPTHGTLSGTAPNFRYTPEPNFHGPDSFTFKVNDGKQDSAVGTFTVHVDWVIDEPTAEPQTFAIVEDTPTTFELVVTTVEDVYHSDLDAMIASPPQHGSLDWVAYRTLHYIPHPNFVGQDSFTFYPQSWPLGVLGPLVTVTLNVTPVNDAPVALAQSRTTAEDQPLTIVVAGTDVDSANLTYAVASGPAHGTLSGTAPNLTYTPAANYSGPDSFTFRANDGALDSAPATVSITVTPVNDAPVAIAQALVVAPGASLEIVLTGSDVEGSALTYGVLTAPAHGTLTGTAPRLVYTPAPGYAGPDSFTFEVNDGALDSAPATIALTVEANTPPSAIAQSVDTAEDTPVALTLAGSDPEGATLAYAVVTPPAHGALSGTPPNLTYTPAPNYAGADSFTFMVNDGQLESEIATVAITVTAVEDAPIASAQSVTTTEDTAVAITLAGNDPEGAALAFAVATQPAHGTLSGTSPNLMYTPAANYAGADSFTFEVSDGARTATATVAITVTPVDDAPTATAQNVTTTEDTLVAIALGGTDVENATLTAIIVTPPAHGTISWTSPSFTYTPAPNYAGPDSFTFKVSDGALDSPPATVMLTVTPVDDAPMATAQSVTTDEDTAAEITLAGVDADGDTLAFTVTTQPAHGTLSGTAPALTYTPATDYHGADSFTFKVADGTSESSIATVNIAVSSVNDAPTANAQTRSVLANEATSVTLTGTDVDGDAITYAVVDEPSVGTLTGTAPELTYTAPEGHRGTITFTFTVSDGTLTSTPATVTLIVNNGPPVVAASASTLVPLEGEEVMFTATAEDPGGDALTYAWDFGDGGRSTELSPTHAYANEGTYTATLSVSDGLETTTASLELTVSNAEPVVVPFDVPATGEEAKAIAFHAGATDMGTADVLTFSWSFGDNTAAVTGADATHTYADDGTYTVMLMVYDGVATVTKMREVEVRNLPPSLDAVAAQAVDAGTELTITLHATDVAGDRDPIAYALVDGPGSVSADGTFTWTPTNEDAGEHTIKVSATDDDGGVGETVFQITVTAVEEPEGCGCSTGSPRSSSALLAIAVASLLRRKRRR